MEEIPFRRLQNGGGLLAVFFLSKLQAGGTIPQREPPWAIREPKGGRRER